MFTLVLNVIVQDEVAVLEKYQSASECWTCRLVPNIKQNSGIFQVYTNFFYELI